jgi:hypothetical protein
VVANAPSMSTIIGITASRVINRPQPISNAPSRFASEAAARTPPWRTANPRLFWAGVRQHPVLDIPVVVMAMPRRSRRIPHATGYRAPEQSSTARSPPRFTESRLILQPARHTTRWVSRHPVATRPIHRNRSTVMRCTARPQGSGHADGVWAPSMPPANSADSSFAKRAANVN